MLSSIREVAHFWLVWMTVVSGTIVVIHCSNIPCSVAGAVVGICAPPHVRNKIRDTIKKEFAAFTPSVGSELYE